MKKLLFIFGITLVLASCNYQPAVKTNETATDSTAVAVDTTDTLAAPVPAK